MITERVNCLCIRHQGYASMYVGYVCFLKYFITQFRAVIMRCTLVNPNPIRVIPVPFLYYVPFMPHDRHILFIWSFLFGFYWCLFEVGIYCGSSLWRVGSDGNGSNQGYEGGFFWRQRRHALSSFLSQFYNLHVILYFTNICYFIPVASVSIDTPTWSACRLLLDTLSSDYI
jgi:hypothetical protein